MFTPIHLLPQYDEAESERLGERWDTEEGLRVGDQVVRRIGEGAREDFLQEPFEEGQLGFMANPRDLKGLLIELDKEFPSNDTFEGTDFSYGVLGGTWRNATFLGAILNFTHISVKFVDCTFAHPRFYGSSLEGAKFMNCDFIDTELVNCSFADVRFERCFFLTNPFFDCKFDEQTVVDHLIHMANHGCKHHLNKGSLAEVFKGIKDAYVAGNVSSKARDYLFEEKQSIRRYNSTRWAKPGAYFLEWVTGYGTRPWNTLIAMALIFLVFSAAFISQIGYSDGLLLSAGAFFTFGANTERLRELNPAAFWRSLYVLESFLGISGMALLITLLARYWFGEA